MQPISGNNRREENGMSRASEAMSEFSALDISTSRLLPRFMRKSIRFAKGLTPAGLIKNQAIQILVLGSIVVFGFGYFIKNADKNSMIASVATTAGFEASSLVVNGNHNLDINILQARLATQLGNSLFSFNVDAARTEVLNDPWIKSATVRKIFPDTIVVDVVERKPVALWKSKGEVHLIARDGFVIGKADPKHMRLPQVVGEGANLAASEFLSVIGRFPTISQKASAYVRVAGRRWNVRMFDGPQVLLPEFDWQYALNDLQDLQNKKKLLERDILQIDMRLPDRLVIKLDPEMAKVRKIAIQNSLKRDWQKT